MYFLWFLPAVLLAVPSCAVWRSMKANHRELSASSLNVFPANRGAVWFTAKTTGISTHMGRRHEGVNAIEKMMEAIKWMLVYENELIADSRVVLFEGAGHFPHLDQPARFAQVLGDFMAH